MKTITNNQMKKIILRVIIRIIYSFSERTPPEVKYSERNFRVASAALAAGELESIV